MVLENTTLGCLIQKDPDPEGFTKGSLTKGLVDFPP